MGIVDVEVMCYLRCVLSERNKMTNCNESCNAYFTSRTMSFHFRLFEFYFSRFEHSFIYCQVCEVRRTLSAACTTSFSTKTTCSTFWTPTAVKTLWRWSTTVTGRHCSAVTTWQWVASSSLMMRRSHAWNTRPDSRPTSFNSTSERSSQTAFWRTLKRRPILNVATYRSPHFAFWSVIISRPTLLSPISHCLDCYNCSRRS